MKILIIISLVLVTGFSVFYFNSQNPKAENLINRINQDDNLEKINYETQSKSMGAVDVSLTPINLEPAENMLFELSLNTHSVELDYDFAQIITALDDQGNVYKVENWLGERGGHHLSGQLEFSSLAENAKIITVKINGIDDESEEFEWQLK